MKEFKSGNQEVYYVLLEININHSEDAFLNHY